MLRQRNFRELQELGSELLSGSWLQMSQRDRQDLIASFCQGYVLPPLSQYTPTTYRARINDARQLYEHIDQLWAPPAQCIAKAGRMNRPGERTLYISGQPVAAIFETKVSVGTMVSVLACRAKVGSQPLILAPVAMPELRSNHRLGPLNPIDRVGAASHPEFGAVLRNTGLFEQWSLQDKILGKLLTSDVPPPDDQALYDLTIGIRDHLYETWNGYDGVRYPSIVVDLTSLNTALDAKRWDDIEPLEVWVTEVCDAMTAGAADAGRIFTRPLIKQGQIRSDGTIEYSETRRTFAAALNDFKQAHGLITGPAKDLAPTLTRPWIRRRISYGSDPNRTVLDLH